MFFIINLLSIIQFFNVFSCSKVTTLIQSRNFVYLFLIFEMFSFVIKIAINVKRAVELVNTIRMLGFNNDIVEIPIADPDPNKFSVIINNTFFFLRIFYFFLKKSLSISRDYSLFSWSCFSVLYGNSFNWSSSVFIFDYSASPFILGKAIY